jgi:putative endonuclease
MFYYTYVLRCIDLKRNKTIFYVGVTDNLINRYKDHKSKSVETTKAYDIIELIYYEASLNKKDAIYREKQLKTGFGRGYIKRRLKNYLLTRD